MPAALIPAGIAAGGAIAGGVFGASGADKQVQAMKDAIAYQKQRDATNQANFQPYLNFGGQQLNSLSNWLKDPNQNPNAYLDPSYEFTREQGMRGVTGNAGTAGLLQSGDTLRGVEQYGQDLAKTNYNNAFNRYLQMGQFKQGLANTGLEAAGGIAGVLNRGAENVGNITANTDFGAPNQTWGNVASGIGGLGANAFARYLQPGGGTTPRANPSNIFAGGSYPTGATTPYYMQA